MHELSIARSLLGLVRENVPDDASVKSVKVRIGPLQAIEPDSMQFAWQAATDNTVLEGVELSMVFLSWQLHCRECGRNWSSENWSDPCTCGSCRADPVGGDELTLESIKVEDSPSRTAPADTPAP
jgi:hydrogenase nickel incorporation protein HypA/HybF